MSSTSSTPAKSASPDSGAGAGTPSPNITPMHDPAHQAKVMKQHKPLGMANPNPIVPGQTTDPTTAAGLGQKALLAKRFAKASKPTVSPTDQLQSPCTAKLQSARQKHFARGKPASLAQSFTAVRDSSSATSNMPSASSTDTNL
ncbi:hypothetical protein EHS25_004216 [Saitozyma podzolica]|uniref:Spo12 n=1 Tax=Saitozyma podzolica TaxID=1890683 RepID=A0A427YTE1_9TREE|nr:hypothetical protein EHS25_004216 [Saitozyma podzolica]